MWGRVWLLQRKHQQKKRNNATTTPTTTSDGSDTTEMHIEETNSYPENSPPVCFAHSHPIPIPFARSHPIPITLPAEVKESSAPCTPPVLKESSAWARHRNTRNQVPQYNSFADENFYESYPSSVDSEDSLIEYIEDHQQLEQQSKFINSRPYQNVYFR